MKRSEIIAECRLWTGTPYLHQGRLMKVGADCLAPIVGILRRFNLPHEDKQFYGPLGQGDFQLLKELEKWLVPVYTHMAKPGSVLVFSRLQRPEIGLHCGVMTELGMIHTHATIGKVVEHGIDASWRKRLVQVFDFPGVED